MTAVKRSSFARALLLAALVAVSVFAPAAWAQDIDEDAAYVPFVVNVDAYVMVRRVACPAVVGVNCGGSTRFVGGEEAVMLRLPLNLTGVARFFGTQGRGRVPAIVGGGHGKVSVNLPAQSYKSAEISLFAVNGKRILRNSVAVTNAESMVMRRSVAPGMYLLSVTGDGGAITYRLAHSGGRLDISVAFGSEKVAAITNQQSKKAASINEWSITVSAVESGYVDSTYSLLTVPGMNPVQNITLREK